jgi:hypothetical protein
VQQHFILLAGPTNAELLSWQSHSPFDGFIFNLQYDDPMLINTIAEMVAAGKKFFRYYAVLDYPFSGTTFGGVKTPPLATWYNWFRENIQFLGAASHRRMRSGNKVGLFSFFGIPSELRELIPWKNITPAENDAIVLKMVALMEAPGGIPIAATGCFLDQAWLDNSEFMYPVDASIPSGHGDTRESLPGFPLLDTTRAAAYAAASTTFGTPGGTWSDHGTVILSFYTKIAASLGATRYAIANGEHKTVNAMLVPKPWIFENAWNNTSDPGADQAARWAFASSTWSSTDLPLKRNVLSFKCVNVQADHATMITTGINYWVANGGWIAFTDDGSANGIARRIQAYADAHAARPPV